MVSYSRQLSCLLLLDCLRMTSVVVIIYICLGREEPNLSGQFQGLPEFLSCLFPVVDEFL